MKKLLSAVTSVAMSFSLMAGAFASPVSAAGGDTASQPKLNMGGVLDVSANKNAGESVEWNIGNAVAAPGMSVTVPVVVSKSTLEVTSAQFKINPASPIKLKSVKAGEAYGANASYDGNLIVLERSSGKGVVASNDSVVINLTFTVPNDCAAGTYKIEASDLFVSDSKSSDITSGVTFGAGSIKVQDKIENGNVSWVLDNVEGAPGETVTLKAYVSDPSSGALAVAGAQFKVKTESPIEFKSLKEGGAYAAPISFDEKVQTYLFDEQSGKGVIAADKATIFNISYTIPSTCPEGTYKVSWSDAFVSDSKSGDITSNVKFVDGSIKVGKSTGDKVTWTLSTEDAKPGDVVTMTAKVSDKAKIALPVGGAQFKLEAKSPITYNKKITEGSAYGAAIKATEGVDRFLFELGGKGKAAEDGSTIFTVDFKVPDDCPDGVYDVNWADTFVTDSKSNDITSDIVLVNGKINVNVGTAVEGKATWVIPSEVQAEAGKSVELVAKVKGDSDLAVAGAQFSIVGTDPTIFNSATGTPYGMELTTDPEYKSNCIFSDVKGKTAKDGDVLFTIKFDVPAGTPDGVYPVKWSKQFVTNEKCVDITDKVTFVNGSIRVGNGTTTTTVSGGSTTTTTTTLPTIPDNALAWQIDTKVMESPEVATAVELRIYVNDKNNAKVGVAGAQFRIKNKDGIEFKSATGSEAYTGKLSLQTEADKTLNAFMFTTENAKNYVAENDKNVAVLTFEVPANCPEGTYNVDFVDGTLNVSDEKSVDITKRIVGIGGAIVIKPRGTVPTTPTSTSTTTASGTTTTVSGSSTTTTASGTTTTVSGSSTTSTASGTTTTVSGSSTTSTASGTTTTVSGSSTTSTASGTTTTVSGSSTTSTASGTTTTVSGSSTTSTTTVTGTTTTLIPGAIIWEIDTVHAKPGETVKVNMYVRDPNAVKLGVAGAQFTVKPAITGDTGAELTGVGAKSGYGSDVITGSDNNVRFFFADKGDHIALDGAVVVEFSYKVGEKAVPGTDIALEISDLFVSNGKTEDITKNVIPVNGRIIVDTPPVIDSSSTTTTTGTGTTTASGTTTTVSGSSTTSTASGTTTTTVSGSSTTTTASGTTTTVSGSSTTSTASGTTTTVSGSSTTSTASGTTTTVSGSSTTSIASGTTTTVSGSSTTSSTTTVTGTTGSGVVKPGILTTTTKYPKLDDGSGKWTTTTEAGYLYSIATIETKPGFYFSHDNDIRAKGDKRGFSPDQVTKLVITQVFEDGTTKVIENAAIDRSWINFGVATPELVYNERTHAQDKAVTLDEFKYEIPVWYGEMPLFNDDAEPLTVPVYIGVKGDVTLSNVVNAVDASAVLSYYASCQTYKNADGKNDPTEGKSKVQIQTDTLGLKVESADDILDHFAAFLADVDQDEYDPGNWSKMKGDRTVDAVDASCILSFYAEKSTSDKSAGDIWKSVLGK